MLHAWQHAKSTAMTKQTTITRKQENKGWKALLEITGELSSVLNQLSGRYHDVLADTGGLTVEAFLATYGVNRYVSAKGKKMGYTPATLAKGWHDAMTLKSDEGKVLGSCVFKNVPATYVASEEDGKEKKYRVYTSKEAAEDPEAESFSMYVLTQVDPCRWNWVTIKRGLVQSKSYDKEQQKADKAAKSWEAVTECYIAKYVDIELKDKNGKVVGKEKVRRAYKINKADVVF